MVEVVRHNGDVDIVSQKELLVGYIIKVNPGMKIPADSILIQCDVEDGILCNESEVTGTNGAQHKVSSDEMEEMCRKRDDTMGFKFLPTNVLYHRSYVIKGEGFAVVCCIGEHTQAGMPHEQL